MNNLSIEELRKLRASCNDNLFRAAFDELIAIRELKGEQVPAALVDERQGSGGFCLTQHGRSLNLQHGTELFTAPQKPVVRFTPPINPVMFNADVMFGYNKARAEDKAAIEAAGGIVKTEGEQ